MSKTFEELAEQIDEPDQDVRLKILSFGAWFYSQAQSAQRERDAEIAKGLGDPKTHIANFCECGCGMEIYAAILADTGDEPCSPTNG